MRRSIASRGLVIVTLLSPCAAGQPAESGGPSGDAGMGGASGQGVAGASGAAGTVGATGATGQGGGGAHGEAGDAAAVVVAGTRVAQTSGAAHLVTSKQLERFELDDPHAVLLSVPGVFVRGEDGFGLRPNIAMRGASPDRSKKITLMEDGVLLAPAPYAAPAAYYFPLITRAAAVRVVKGPASIGFGPHTTGGAVDVVTAAIPDGRRGMADVALGQFGYRKAHVRYGASTDEQGFVLEGVHLGSSGFMQLDGGGDTGFSRNEWMAKVRRTFGHDTSSPHEVQLKIGYFDESSRETYVGLTDDDFRATPYRRYASSRLDRMASRRTQIELSHVARLRPELDLTSTVYRHDLGRIWSRLKGARSAKIADVYAQPDDPANAPVLDRLRGRVDAAGPDEALLYGPNDRTFVAEGVQTLLRYRPATGPVAHKIELGTRLHHDRVLRAHAEGGLLTRGGDLVPDGLGEKVTADDRAEALALAVHLVDAMTWGRVTLTPGVRVESIVGRFVDRLEGTSASSTQRVALPGAGVFVSVAPEGGVFAGAHRGFSPVPPGGGPTASPETSWSYEAGTRWGSRLGKLELVGFVNDYANLTSVCGYSGGCAEKDLDAQVDAGRARAWGLEALAEAEPRWGEGVVTPLRVAYTLTRTRFLAAFESFDPAWGDVEVGDEMPYVPRHQLYASAGVEARRFGVVAAGTYVGRMREVAGSGEPPAAQSTDPCLTLDASAYFAPSSDWRAYVNLRNALDAVCLASRQPLGARPNAPRSAQFGLKMAF